MKAVNYKVSEKFISDLGCDFLTIEAVKENKVIKSISFYKNVDTCLGVEKMNNTYAISSKIGFDGTEKEISRESVEEIIEFAKKNNIQTLVK